MPRTTGFDEYKSSAPADRTRRDCRRRRVEKRLKHLCRLNREIEARLSETDACDGGSIASTGRFVTPEQSYRFFGITLGILPPAAIFIRLFGSAIKLQSEILPLYFILCFSIACTAFVGYALGAEIQRLVRKYQYGPWPLSIISQMAAGLVWGILSGGAGGFVFVVVGSMIGAIVGGIVGAIAVAIFGSLFRLFAYRDGIELRRLLPLAIGTSALISAAILGYPAG